MSVQFILGRSGSGKSRYCIDSLIKELLDRHDTTPLVLLVPEQATYQAERAILSHPQIAGFQSAVGSPQANPPKADAFSDPPQAGSPNPSGLQPGLNILSFDRLQFLLLGKRTAENSLSGIGRQMIVHRILIENRDKLKLFGRTAVSPGLSQKIADAIIELHQYSDSPQDVRQLVEKLNQDEDASVSALKFSDLAFVLQQYLEFIEDSLVDPDTQLGLVKAAVGQCTFLKDARLWVDGFAGFSTTELSLLAELLKIASQTHIALCLDTDKINLDYPDKNSALDASLFHPTEKTYTDLFGIIKKNKLKLAKPVILKQNRRFLNTPAMRHLEQNIFRQNAPKIAAGDNLQIASLPDARSEVRFVARQICRLVRQKQLRYRDIAVIASDLKLYEHYVRAVFEDYRLPFFIDRRQSLRHHPTISLLVSALRSAVSGLTTADIIACLKTGIFEVSPVGEPRLNRDSLSASSGNDRRLKSIAFSNGVSDYEIDNLENYCIAFAVAPDAWAAAGDWDFDDIFSPAFDQAQVNRIRRKAVAPLLKLRAGLCDSGGIPRKLTARRFTEIVFEFLDACQISKQLKLLTESAESQKDYEAADEHRQVYDRIVDIFDELCEAFADFELSADEFFSIIQDACCRASLALIPPALDQVTVGSIERSRHPDLKAVFLIGTTQKQFPAPLNYERLLTDEDRLTAQSAGVELAPATERQLSERRYLSYIAFTRPSQFLSISYPAVDDRGRQICRSQFIDDVETLFDDLSEQIPIPEEADLAAGLINPDTGDKLPINNGEIFTDAEFADLLCLQAAKDDRLMSLIDCLNSDKQLSELTALVRSAVGYSNVAKLQKGIVSKLFTKQLNSSATILQTFAACPYQYFARFVLELKERKEFKLEPIDLGIFYHRCLDAFFTHIKTEKININSVKDDKLKKILEKSIADVAAGSSYFTAFCRRSSHNREIIRFACQNLQSFILANIQMIRAGNFRPAFTELSFGKNNSPLGFFKLKLKNPDKSELSLSGKIDRVDLAAAYNDKLAIVFDYKTKGRSFNWQRFFSGLDIQLPLYMLAIRNSKQKAFQSTGVAGAFFLPIEVAPEPADLDKIEEKIGRFNYKAKGIFNGEYYQTLDSGIESGWSRYYKFFISKEKQQYGFYDTSSDALTAEDFENILRFAENKIVDLAQRILTGEIRLRPYRLGNITACQLCEFKALCRFDGQINDYNFLPAVSKTDVLETTAFSPVPKESKNQINKAGQILVKDNPSRKELDWARNLTNRWRACHAYPINTFQATLRVKLRDFRDPIVAQRLKRMPTIIDKLKQYPDMQLTTMQDIGGLRAVLGSVADVYRLADSYRDNIRLIHELIGEKDYIEHPKEDGYRSLHLIYKYKNKRNSAYDDLRIELQIRTKLQHTWATAVETMGTFLGQALKSRQGDQEWIDFFAITSSAFAYKEETPCIPRYKHLSHEETFSAVVKAESDLGALDKMSGFSVAVNAIVKSKRKSWSYHLIVLNSLKGTVSIRPYDRESFDQAMEDYSKVEAEAAEGNKIEPVLVSVGRIDELRKAYPNFFLDMSDFMSIVREIVKTAKK